MAKKEFLKESKAKKFIDQAFKDRDNKPWVRNARRFNDYFNGKWNTRINRQDRFVNNSVFALVNLILPNFVLQQPEIRALPQNPRYMVKKLDGSVLQRDAVTQARIRSASINHTYNKIKAIAEDRKAVQDALFYGFGVCKTGYSLKTISEEDKDYIKEDTAFRQRVNPEDIGWSPLATDFSDSPLVVHRIFTTKELIKENDKYDSVSGIKSEIPQRLQEKLKDVDKKEFITIYEVHDQQRDKVMTFAGDECKLIDKRDNPYDFNGSHFSMVKFAGDNDDFPGISMLFMVEDEMLSKNEILTLMVEHTRKFPGQGYYDLGSMDEDDLTRIQNTQQGSLHGVPDTTKLKFTSPLSMGVDYFNLLSTLDAQMDRTLGIPDFQRLTSTTRKSATEASFIQGDATIRRNYFLKLVKEFVLDGIEKVAMLQAQFQDEKELVAASGEMHEPFEFTKEDIQGDYLFDFDVDNLSSVNQTDMNNIINLMQTMSQFEAFKPIIQQMAPGKMAKKLFKMANLNIEEIMAENVENSVHVTPERENELALSGEPMPQPKKGEDYDYHIKIHRQALEEGAASGQFNQQIAEHIAVTTMVRDKELGVAPPPQPQKPKPGAGGAQDLPKPGGLQGPNQLI